MSQQLRDGISFKTKLKTSKKVRVFEMRKFSRGYKGYYKNPFKYLNYSPRIHLCSDLSEKDESYTVIPLQHVSQKILTKSVQTPFFLDDTVAT